MPIVTLVHPAGYPVTVAEARDHLRIDEADDAAIGRALAAATYRCELFCMARFVAQTVRWSTLALPIDYLALPLVPVRSVDSIVFATAGGPVTLERAAYHLAMRGRQTIVRRAPGAAWPSPAPVEDPIAVTMTLGAPAGEIPDHIKAAVLMTAARYYDNRSGDSDLPPAAQSLLMGETW